MIGQSEWRLWATIQKPDTYTAHSTQNMMVSTHYSVTLLTLVSLLLLSLCVSQLCQAHTNYAVLDISAASTRSDIKDLYSSRTVVTVDQDSGQSDAIPLPFIFDFFGMPQTEIFVHRNGFITFKRRQTVVDSGDQNDNGSRRGGDQSTKGFIAAFWSDFNPSPAGDGDITFHSATVKSAQGDAGKGVFSVKWTDLTHKNASGTASFQIILSEDGDIEFQYDAISANIMMSTKLVGIESTDGFQKVDIEELVPAVAIQSSIAMITGTKRLTRCQNNGMYPDPYGPGCMHCLDGAMCSYDDEEVMREEMEERTHAQLYRSIYEIDQREQELFNTQDIAVDLDIAQTCILPFPPRNLTVLAFNRDSVTLTWLPPLMPGVPAFFEYQINVTEACVSSPNTASLSTFSEFVDRNVTTFTVDNLQPNMLYIFSVQAVSNCTDILEESPPSNLVEQATLFPTPPQTPPFDLFVLDQQCNSISLSWTFVDEAPFNGGSPITGFTIQYNPSGFPKHAFLVFIPFNGSRPMVTLRNLVPATEYEIRIRAVNSFGAGPCAVVILSTLFCFP